MSLIPLIAQSKPILDLLPTLIGGVGGSIITLVSGLLIARRGKKRIFFSKASQKFALPSVLTQIEGTQHPLKVSLGGEVFDHLTRSTFQVSNVGRVAVPACTLVVHFPSESRLLSAASSVAPLPTEVPHSHDQLDDATHQHTFSIPTLEAGDRVEVSMLFDGQEHTLSLLRGLDGVQVLQERGELPSDLVSIIISAVLLMIMAGLLTMLASPNLQSRFYGLLFVLTGTTITIVSLLRALNRRNKRINAHLQLAKA